MKYIYVSKQVETCIQVLRKSGKAGVTLAGKTKQIIARLAVGKTRRHLNASGGFTKYGEKRIKNCRKYDLGCGYRLIVLQRGHTLFIPFLGTHDHCQRWLDKNSRLKDYHSGAGRIIRVVEEQPVQMIEHTEKAIDDHDADIQFTEDDLRTVFSGLVQGKTSKHHNFKSE